MTTDVQLKTFEQLQNPNLSLVVVQNASLMGVRFEIKKYNNIIDAQYIKNMRAEDAALATPLEEDKELFNNFLKYFSQVYKVVTDDEQRGFKYLIRADTKEGEFVRIGGTIFVLNEKDILIDVRYSPEHNKKIYRISEQEAKAIKLGWFASYQ